MIEVIQALPFIDRDSDVMDWVADTVGVGAVVGVVLTARLRRELARSR
jgi:VanZ family protein